MNWSNVLPFDWNFGSEETNGRQVRFLVKPKGNLALELEQFNRFVADALERMNENTSSTKATLDSDLRDNLKEGYLKKHHLTYEIQMGTKSGQSGDSLPTVAETDGGSTFKVILRGQPNKAIEINGPKELVSSYCSALEEVFEEQQVNPEIKPITNL